MESARAVAPDLLLRGLRGHLAQRVRTPARLRAGLADVVALPAGWYAGRLERGYARREPSTAADYLRSVGLNGTFWGVASE
jgi:hypothetical protein